MEINTDSLTTVGNYIKAVGCGARRNGRDTDSAIYSTTSTISFKPVDAGAIEFAYDSNSNFDADGKILHGGQVILTSTNAVRICYRVGSSGDDPTCHSNGTCVGTAKA